MLPLDHVQTKALPRSSYHRHISIFTHLFHGANPYCHGFMQPIWNAIIGFNPHVFIWMGDNIYGEIRRPWKLFGKERTLGPWKNAPRFAPASRYDMQHKYNIAKSNPSYSRLRRSAKVSCFTPSSFLSNNLSSSSSLLMRVLF